MSIRILIVDPAGSTEVRSHLRQVGYSEIDVTDNGMAALEILRLRQHQLVLSEWRCRDMMALDLLGLIREERSLRHSRFALLTAHRQPSDVGAAKQAGAHSYILKPYTLATLKQRLQALLGAPAPALARVAAR
jgi:two-component system, chemotaxis family, chemotaxis protein CheY